jgi:transcription elongation factor GreA
MTSIAAPFTSNPTTAIPTPAADLPVTAAAYDALVREVVELRYEKFEVLPERLRTAHEYGDGSNNDDTLAIREEEAVIDARLARLESVLRRARIIPPAASSDVVALGSRVSVRDVGSSAVHDYVIDSAHSSTAPGGVSVVSPVGIALLGRRSGDVVAVDLPNGRVRELEILKISA